jgi:predicted negative regulator of RcsB-dependent stress response
LKQGRLEAALTAYRDGLAVVERLAAAESDETQWQSAVLSASGGVGDVLMAQGRPKEALTFYRRSLAVAQRLAVAEPLQTDWQRDMSIYFRSVGDALLRQGEVDEAIDAYRDGLAIAQLLAGMDRNDALWPAATVSLLRSDSPQPTAAISDGNAICRPPI